MIIRPVLEEDVPAVIGLTRGAMSFASSPDPAAWEVPGEELEARIRAFLDPQSGMAMLLEVENTTAAFVAARFEKPHAKHTDRIAIIDLLAVDQEHRGQGFGTHLVRELLIQLPSFGITKLQVSVVGSNEAAMRFWRRAGFTEHHITLGMDVPRPA